MEQHLPILPVLFPLLFSPLMVLLGKGRSVAWATLAVTLITLASTALLYMQVSTFGVQHYALGGWVPPIGIAYRVDLLSATIALLVSAMAFCAAWYGMRMMREEIIPAKHHLFLALFLLCLAGLLGMVLTNDLFNFYVFLEISSLATYALIAKGKDKRALTSAFNYLILGSVGATFILIGIGFLYFVTGTLNISDLAMRLPAHLENPAIRTGCLFLLIGLMLKIALFPLHHWLVNAYAYAPNVITVFLSATATKVGIYILIRVIDMFGWRFVMFEMHGQWILLVLASTGVVICSLIACYQEHVKRLLAFSSVAHLGYIVIGIALASELGVQSAVTHVVNHAVAKAALFMAVGALVWRLGGARFEYFYGAGKTMPLTMALCVLASLSLVGVPLTAGFVSKWLLFMAVWDSAFWPLLFLLIASSLMGIYYLWRVIEVAYFRTRPAALPRVKEAPRSVLVPILVLVLINFWLGVDTSLTADPAAKIAYDLVRVDTLGCAAHGGGR